ncbi:sodium/hydrogen exchanger 8 [Iris pallida]|uniref:Sodium/hydrogen exchanger 8 n=1 Tax=Iris pallida TaxID=29817 RepID=A0AAX6EZE9_IRIPA|nr:sodium/hydrogen exchanger 8 [Iris pallida]
MLEEGRITQSTASLLMRSIDEAMDVVYTQPLCDWKGLKSNVHFPDYYRFVQMSKLPRRFVTYFTVERLESSCYICAAFLRAHRTARRQLHDFIGDSEIASIVINESEEEGEEAVKFLEDVRVTFPQVLRVVKTRQVTYSILKHLSDYVQNLEKIGLLEEKEMVHLDDAVQTDLKKLLRNPPLVKMPKVGELLRTHPLLGALPSAVREPFEVSTKEILKMRGLTLYKEGSKPNGNWLISVGVVKWTSKRLSNRHSLHPVFSHGSTLGLYEVLVGRPYICGMITDSVVHCLFLETEKIKSLLKTDPAIEDFLWQESAIIIAKLLYPQKFEKMSMHELRGLVAERSTMNIHIQGEVIEIRPHSIGFLLEGFVKTQDSHQDLFTSPSVLLPSQADLDLSTQESPGVKNASFCHKGSWYQVETRVRVIIFDISTTESEGALLKRYAPRLSTFIEPPRNLSRDHEGLLSWPENLLKSREHQSFNEGDRGATTLSAKAMELSIYGSMVADVRRHYRSSQRTSQLATTDHSLSYPSFPSSSGNARPLLSVQSEGGSMNKRVGSKVSSIPPLPTRRRKAALVEDNSSDESGGEEVVVRVDSPSTLSFHHEGS